MNWRGIQNQRGFTLIELLVVMLILAVLAALAYAAYVSQTNKASDTEAQQALYTASKTVQAEYVFDRALPAEAALISAVNEGEPSLSAHAYNGGANPSTGPRNISLTRESAAQATICSHSDSGRFYCLRTNQQAELVVAAVDPVGDDIFLASLDPTGLLFPDTAHAAALGNDAHISICSGDVEADTRDCLATASVAAHEVGTASPGWGGSSVEVAPPPDPGPENVSLPVISGTTTVGDELSSSTGSWNGNPTSFDRQWQRCDAAGDNCSAITGATASTYTLVNADLGSTLRVEVTAHNASGAASATSEASSEVLPQAPANTALPTISGTASVGSTLTGANGSWSNNPSSFSVQWRRCDASGNNCTDIAGATNASYTLVSGDVGSTIRFRVTAANAGGSASASSNQTATIAAPTLSYAQEVSNDSPSARCRFNESGTSYVNTSCSGLSGQYQTDSSVYLTQQTGAIVGDSNKAIRFTGASHYSYANPSSGATSNQGANWSVEAWVKPSSNSPSQVIVSADDNWALRMVGSSGFACSTRTGNPWNVVSIQGGSAAQSGSWYHVACTYSSGTMKLYVNGSQVATQSGVAQGQSGNGNVRPGYANGGWVGGGYLNGTIDEFAFYKSALSAARVQAHYQAAGY